MKNIIKALVIGLMAGVIDVTPMIIQGLPMTACLSAFVHWVVLGLIIPYLNWNIKPWLKGLIVSELSALPIMIIVFEQEPMSLIPMALFSAVLGIGVAIIGNRFIKA